MWFCGFEIKGKNKNFLERWNVADMGGGERLGKWTSGKEDEVGVYAGVFVK